jgi:hypothetical protein
LAIGATGIESIKKVANLRNQTDNVAVESNSTLCTLCDFSLCTLCFGPDGYRDCFIFNDTCSLNINHKSQTQSVRDGLHKGNAHKGQNTYLFTMIEKSIQRLQFLCDTVPSLLRKINEAEFKQKPTVNNQVKWSKQEIVGHLIDSAANNHQRFIRIQYEHAPKIVYDQDAWNRLNNYNALPMEQVIHFWESYNRHLVEVMKNIPEANLTRTGITSEEYTLQWLIDDYVVHLEYHMRQVVAYD